MAVGLDPGVVGVLTRRTGLSPGRFDDAGDIGLSGNMLRYTNTAKGESGEDIEGVEG